MITGDLVASRQAASRDELLSELKSALNMVDRNFSARHEIYRGDSFQVFVPNPGEAMRAAILLRAHLRAVSDSSKPRWDARVSVGVGEAGRHRESLGESSGEAFELSGLGLDALSETGGRLVITTPSDLVNEQLALPTRFADDIISNWSHYSAEIAYFSLLLDESQSELGKLLGKKQPTIHARLVTARMKLIEAYIERVRKVVEQEFAG
ncbi:MAG: hypothetical protein HKN58_11800 [Xanthomonadales bacterium]|nr:hypothetical protein [Xanthomonadales bacterium]